MRTLLFTAMISLTALACSKDAGTPAAPPQKLADSVPEVTVAELAAKLGPDCQAVDANGDATRKKMGVIPGAVLLSDSEAFSTSELPADKSKTLVFYCTNAHCGASSDAAARALMAGYKNVKVLPDGIAGWVAAGQHVQNI